eukprot:11110144-Heterocapsa_arctica.AAC.1
MRTIIPASRTSPCAKKIWTKAVISSFESGAREHVGRPFRKPPRALFTRVTSANDGISGIASKIAATADLATRTGTPASKSMSR